MLRGGLKFNKMVLKIKYCQKNDEFSTKNKSKHSITFKSNLLIWTWNK